MIPNHTHPVEIFTNQKKIFSCNTKLVCQPWQREKDLLLTKAVGDATDTSGALVERDGRVATPGRTPINNARGARPMFILTSRSSLRKVTNLISTPQSIILSIFVENASSLGITVVKRMTNIDVR
jgi:hypothetical protein